jgi:hypothetical protein
MVVNGERGEAFTMERVVCQGCLRTPYLYLFITDVMGYMVLDPSYEIEGLILLDGRQVWDQMFANDTILFLKGTINNLQKSFQVFQTFCHASGGKFNWHKSCAIWASKKPREWSWGNDKGLVWLATNKVTKYLGFPINYNMPQKEKDNKVL